VVSKPATSIVAHWVADFPIGERLVRLGIAGVSGHGQGGALAARLRARWRAFFRWRAAGKTRRRFFFTNRYFSPRFLRLEALGFVKGRLGLSMA
jgi:hypothetical protein